MRTTGGSFVIFPELSTTSQSPVACRERPSSRQDLAWRVVIEWTTRYFCACYASSRTGTLIKATPAHFEGLEADFSMQ